MMAAADHIREALFFPELLINKCSAPVAIAVRPPRQRQERHKRSVLQNLTPNSLFRPVWPSRASGQQQQQQVAAATTTTGVMIKTSSGQNVRGIFAVPLVFPEIVSVSILSKRTYSEYAENAPQNDRSMNYRVD